MLQEIARGGLLTGVVASIAATLLVETRCLPVAFCEAKDDIDTARGRWGHQPET
jgi:hypothetical protein